MFPHSRYLSTFFFRLAQVWRRVLLLTYFSLLLVHTHSLISSLHQNAVSINFFPDEYALVKSSWWLYFYDTVFVCQAWCECVYVFLNMIQLVYRKKMLCGFFFSTQVVCVNLGWMRSGFLWQGANNTLSLGMYENPLSYPMYRHDLIFLLLEKVYFFVATPFLLRLTGNTF